MFQNLFHLALALGGVGGELNSLTEFAKIIVFLYIPSVHLL